MSEINSYEFIQFMKLCNSELRRGLPRVSGNMRRSVKTFVGNSKNERNVVLGSIVIQVPYAHFVNETGHKKYPNSTKLAKDYHLVQKIVTRCCKITYETKGAKVYGQR